LVPCGCTYCVLRRRPCELSRSLPRRRPAPLDPGVCSRDRLRYLRAAVIRDVEVGAGRAARHPDRERIAAIRQGGDVVHERCCSRQLPRPSAGVAVFDVGAAARLPADGLRDLDAIGFEAGVQRVIVLLRDLPGALSRFDGPCAERVEERLAILELSDIQLLNPRPCRQSPEGFNACNSVRPLDRRNHRPGRRRRRSRRRCRRRIESFRACPERSARPMRAYIRRAGMA
jgi:hypothetical protein